MTSILKFYKDLERYGLFKDSQFILNIPIELLNELVDKHQSNLSEIPTSSQTEISDEEIEKASIERVKTRLENAELNIAAADGLGFMIGAEWYREQLKSKLII